MEIDQELYSNVVEFVKKETCYRKEIKPNTLIYHDMGITGTDAYYFMVDFMEKFNVDMFQFIFDRHFGPQWPLFIFGGLLWPLFEPEKFNASGTLKMIPITVLDLYEAAKTKKFPDLSNRPAE